MEEFNHGKIEHVNISQEMKSSFLDYSMSVIIARALPDVKDGMKPVHRRILYAMYDLGMTNDKPHRKSARIVGDVIAKYHPHGDVAVYDSMVRMAQPFSYRYRLVDGHGNFGSIDGDKAAAMRYTEARMSKISSELIRDLYKDTVDWVENYDGELKEPTVLPCRFPNLLVNGATGIAVGMATNIPPHNLCEAIDATIAIIDNPEISVVELMNKHIKGPDFPTGGYIVGSSNIKKAYETGRGSITIRSKTEIEETNNNKKRIIIRELPYQVNKAQLVEKIAHLVRDKLIDGITSLNDESNREGIKVVIDLRRDVQAEVILNQLYRLTALQTTFGVNSVVLVGKTPRQVGLKELLTHYINHQIDVVKKATAYDLHKAEEKAHILEGFKIALDNIDEVIEIIRNSKDVTTASQTLRDKFKLSEIQTKAILDMQFKRLTGLERNKIVEDLENTLKIIEDLKDILNNHQRVINIIKNDLIEVKNKYGDERKTEIIEEELELLDEDLIPVDNVIISMTTNGYIKRIPLSTYKLQNRGGKGVKGMGINNDDIIEQFINMETHDKLLLFSNLGRVYRIKGYQIPEASRIAKGIPLVNILSLQENEKIKSLISYKETNEDDQKYLFFVTKNGLCKRTSFKEFKNINQNGKIAINLRENDELIGVRITEGNNEILIGSSQGKVIRFNENIIRPLSRIASGVKAMNVDGGEVIGFATTIEGEYIFVISEKGYGKLSNIDDYRILNRGGKGVLTTKTTEKNGKIVTLKAVKGDEDCLIITDKGIVIRIDLKSVSIAGRATQGVKLIKTNENNIVSTVVIVEKEENEDINNINEELEDNDE